MISLLKSLWMISLFKAIPDIIAVEAATLRSRKVGGKVFCQKFTDVIDHCKTL